MKYGIVDTTSMYNFKTVLKLHAKKIAFKISFLLISLGLIATLYGLLLKEDFYYTENKVVVCGKYISYKDEDFKIPKYTLVCIDYNKNNSEKHDPINFYSANCDKKTFEKTAVNDVLQGKNYGIKSTFGLN